MNVRKLVMLLGIFVLLLAFLASAPLALWIREDQVIDSRELGDVLVLWLGFGVALTAAYIQVSHALQQYIQDFHDLSTEDAAKLVSRLFFGLPQPPLRSPVLRVQAGQVDLEAPPLLHRVGGPARLVIDLNSVVVTSKLGRLSRVLGPGVHTLAAFERVWDVVDLRPQRRSLTVTFMTRDGIPASCQVGIVCRVARDADLPTPEGAAPAGTAPYSEAAILKVTTEKFVRKSEGHDRVADWVVGIANGALDGVVRDVLEKHRLDEFLDPRVSMDEESRASKTPGRVERLIPELEQEIAQQVRATGLARGIVVERVELGVIRPVEPAVSRQWLEFWQAKTQRKVDEQAMKAESTRLRLAEDMRAELQVTFLDRMLKELEGLRDKGVEVPPQLILVSYIEAINSVYDSNPQMQQLMFRQVQDLLATIDTVQRDDLSFTSSRLDVDRPLPSPKA